LVLGLGYVCRLEKIDNTVRIARMTSFVDGLAALTGLRDRDELDFAFVRLLSRFAGGTLGSTTLVQIFSVGEDR